MEFPEKEPTIKLEAAFKNDMSSYATKEELEEATKVFVFTQGIADNVWTIKHNLNRQISSVTIVNSANEIIMPNEAEIVDYNIVIITFLAAFAGTAYIR